MYLLVCSPIMSASCFGFDFLSVSLSISSFNSIISSCFGGWCKCAHPSQCHPPGLSVFSSLFCDYVSPVSALFFFPFRYQFQLRASIREFRVSADERETVVSLATQRGTVDSFASFQQTPLFGYYVNSMIVRVVSADAWISCIHCHSTGDPVVLPLIARQGYSPDTSASCFCFLSMPLTLLSFLQHGVWTSRSCM